MGWFDSQIREDFNNNNSSKGILESGSVVMKETNETFADTRSTGNQNALTQIVVISILKLILCRTILWIWKNRWNICFVQAGS